MDQLFPFEYVEKKSKVFIYGLGKYGRSYLQQIEATKWCEVVGTSDSNCNNQIEGYPFVTIKDLHNVEADYIVIAISAIEKVNQVYWKLREYGVPDSKIVSTLDRTHQNYKYPRNKPVKQDKLQILILATGGLGDCVVYLSLYEKMVSIVQNAEIDIQCWRTYGQALFADKHMVRSIINKDEVPDFESYDLVLKLLHGIYVVRYDEERCKFFSLELCDKVKLLKQTYDDLHKEILSDQYCFAVQIRRAIIKGWNRYYALGHGSVLNLSSDMVKVDLSKEYRKEYQKLKLEKFITVNRGADKRLSNHLPQTKEWPVAYYEELLFMFKEKFPQYEIVQVGSNDTSEIKGVDKYIKGQDLELIKYILKNSTLHFDCEGGLVHLATALGTKCAVVFGPTPIEYYGYDQNINIRSGKCHNCMGLLETWYVKCLRGKEKAECMYSSTPTMVLDKISEYLYEIGEK